MGMIGIRTPDNTVFLADSICSKKVLDKSGIMFIYDIGRFLDTLDSLEKIDGKIYVPSHAEATDNNRMTIACDGTRLLWHSI